MRVNGVEFEEMLMLLRDEVGGYWIEAGDHERLRLNPPGGPPHQQEGRIYYPLGRIAGARIELDAAIGLLDVSLPASAFSSQQFNAQGTGADRRLDTATGLFANYDLYAQRAGDSTVGSAYAEFGLFSGFGLLTSSSVFRSETAAARHVRLDTTLSRDFPERLQTLSVGDSITDPGIWGSALRFGGVRFARNFGIQPDLVTTPLLTASGSAVVPSTVDVFINNQRVLSEEVQPGAFTIDDLPAVTGAGDINLVVRDVMGREVFLSQAFYSSPQLLAAGLSQYSVAAGSLRENYTLSSFDYGAFVASANLRRGLTDRVTVAGHAEYLQGGARAAGLDVASLLGDVGVATVTLASGGDDSSHGWLGGLGFEHRGRRGGFAVLFQYATDGFRRGADADLEAYRMRFRGVAQASWSFGRAGSTSMAYARRSFQNASVEQTLSLGHSVQLGRGSLNLSASRIEGPSPQTMGYLTYTMAFGQSRSFEAAAESSRGDSGDRNEVRATVMQSTPAGEGSGWRLSAAKSGSYDAWWAQRFRSADLELRAARNYGQSGQSIQLRGGASLLGGDLRVSRPIDGSFAVVDIAGIPDVPVYVENQLVARTDSKGRALLPSLLSYDINRISIEPQDLPLNTTIDSRNLEVRPAYRSGVIARFAVERAFPATFRLVQEDGRPVPAGARVQLNGGTASVALQGMTYVTTLDRAAAGIVEWQDGRCEFHVEPDTTDDPLPDLGVIPCLAPAPPGQ